jgi:hypothetical protein
MPSWFWTLGEILFMKDSLENIGAGNKKGYSFAPGPGTG